MIIIIIILPFLYRYGKWSVTLTDEGMLRVFENRTLNRGEIKLKGLEKNAYREF